MPRTNDSGENGSALADVDFRRFGVRFDTLDESGRSVEATIATEAAVEMPDYARKEIIPEALLMSGLVLPASRQVPLLDGHDIQSTRSHLGSIRELRVEGERLLGRLSFSSQAEEQWTKVREGHVTDVSAGYKRLAKVYVPRGQTRIVEGRSFQGPINVITRWKLREGSIIPVGADEGAKLRGVDLTVFRRWDDKENWMTPQLLEALEARGLARGASDEEIQAFMLAELAKRSETPTGPDTLGDTVPAASGDGTRSAGGDANRGAAGVDLREEVRRAIEAERAERAAFEDGVRELCTLAELPHEFEAARSLGSLDAVRTHLFAKKRDQQPAVGLAGRASVTGEGKERHYHALRHAFVGRCLAQTDYSPEAIGRRMADDEIFERQPEHAKNARDFRGMGMLDLARTCLDLEGIDSRRLSNDQVAHIALGFGDQLALRSADYGARAEYTHYTGSFLKITQDALNKSMMLGYTEYPATWRGPMRQAPSVADFKTIHRMRLGAIPNAPIWIDGNAPKSVSFADAEETYAVEARSLHLAFSWKLLINDDPDVLSRKPAEMGRAFSRTVNAVAWQQITDNPTMGDGVALFAAASGARKRTNLSTGSATPTTATLQTMTNLMMQMRGENTPEGNEGPDILNLQPVYLIGGSALRTTILQLIKSLYDPADANMKYNTAGQLMPVIEPLLDANSTTAWYLFASPQQIDTVEVTFLAGQENPVPRFDVDTKTLTRNYYMLQTFAAKAMNHRGMQKHAGA